MNLEALFQNPKALPTAPKVVEQLISSFENEDVTTESIAAKLSTDPVLSAKLLRLANSAYYHVSRGIGNVDDAIKMLGFVTVRTLVISSGLVGGFKTVPGLDLKQFWRYSLNTAVSAKWIAKQTGENTDLAFTIGMMHALGQLVLHSAMPGPAQELGQSTGPFDAGRLDAEHAKFGYNFADVGAELALRWKFPEVFVNAIRAFPDPLGADAGPSRLAGVIALGAWRARIDDDQLSDEARASYPVEIGAMLGLAPSAVLDKMPTLSDLSAGLEELVH